jgi:hypothetical protein
MKDYSVPPYIASQSPWLGTQNQSSFKTRFLLSEIVFLCSTVHFRLYGWILKNNGVDLFFKGLAEFAPTSPVLGYQGKPVMWVSLPTGIGHTIYIVMGHDGKGTLRLVGGNTFTKPIFRRGLTLSSSDFFTQYDHVNGDDRKQLVREAVEKSARLQESSELDDLQRQCDEFFTMPVYTVILTKSGSMLHAEKALITAKNTFDTSHQFFGEIK